MNTYKQPLDRLISRAGGVENSANALNLPASTLRAYINGWRYPGPTRLAQLLEYTGGQLDINALIETHKAKKAQQRKPRRLSAARLVADMSTLKALFEELDLPAARLNLKAPAVLARWKTTHVTVEEVRAAVAELTAAGADAGDIEQIHKTIGATRTAQLAKLKGAA